MNRRHRKTVNVVTGFMSLCIVGYVVGPLCWHLGEGLATTLHAASCSPCICDCSIQPLLTIPEEWSNHSFQECVKHARETGVTEGIGELLAEKVKLMEAQAREGQLRADRPLLDAKRMASQYQKEADKCNMGMETCEEAREKAEEALSEQRSLSAIWEHRARQMGWQDRFLIFRH